MAIRLEVVLATSKLEVPAAFWIWKAVVELVEFWDKKLPLKRLLPLKVCGPLPASRATLADRALSATLPVLAMVASLVSEIAAVLAMSLFNSELPRLSLA